MHENVIKYLLSKDIHITNAKYNDINTIFFIFHSKRITHIVQVKVYGIHIHVSLLISTRQSLSNLHHSLHNGFLLASSSEKSIQTQITQPVKRSTEWYIPEDNVFSEKRTAHTRQPMYTLSQSRLPALRHQNSYYS